VSRLSICLVCLAPFAAAQPGYEAILRDARRLEKERRPGEQPDVALTRAFRRLADAAELAPKRWEAYALRGVNRCETALVCRVRLEQILRDGRARGDSDETLRGKANAGFYYIEECIEAARQNFQVMERLMRASGDVDRNRLEFAAAALQLAGAQYLKTKDGEVGAIARFQALVERGYNVDACSEYIARCYVQLGVDVAAQSDFEQAQAYWDQALEWAKSPSLTRLILSNKAAAYDLDNEYGSAEAILRRLIELEPRHPGHWKNLGLMLGHQNRVRGALRAYERARELCRERSAPVPLAYFHGNAWLKAAMIHGKLLENDGDVRLAWRLSLEYRALFGDDYNFSLNFGEFAFHMGEYDLAWTFLTRASRLQPFCAIPRQLLLMTAQRMRGPADEARARIKKARAEFREAQRRFKPREESASVKRTCAGLLDRTGGDRTGGPTARLDPDPLAGLTADAPPRWILAAAAQRSPFDPDTPDPDASDGPDRPDATADATVDSHRPLFVWIGGAILLLAGATLLLRRTRK